MLFVQTKLNYLITLLHCFTIVITSSIPEKLPIYHQLLDIRFVKIIKYSNLHTIPVVMLILQPDHNPDHPKL